MLSKEWDRPHLHSLAPAEYCVSSLIPHKLGLRKDDIFILLIASSIICSSDSNSCFLFSFFPQAFWWFAQPPRRCLTILSQSPHVIVPLSLKMCSGMTNECRRYVE